MTEEIRLRCPHCDALVIDSEQMRGFLLAVLAVYARMPMTRNLQAKGRG